MTDGMIQQKIAIYGAGSMGTVLGAYLSKAGLAADLVSRDREHVDSSRFKILIFWFFTVILVLIPRQRSTVK